MTILKIKEVLTSDVLLYVFNIPFLFFQFLIFQIKFLKGDQNQSQILRIKFNLSQRVNTRTL